MNTTRTLAALAVGLPLLGGCESYREGPPAPPPLSPPPRHAPVDTCGASELQYLMGRPVDEAPQGGRRQWIRVISTGEIVNDLYDPKRVTIVYERDTGRITRVRCG